MTPAVILSSLHLVILSHRVGFFDAWYCGTARVREPARMAFRTDRPGYLLPAGHAPEPRVRSLLPLWQTRPDPGRDLERSRFGFPPPRRDLSPSPGSRFVRGFPRSHH